ncbi:Uncharacterised protein [Leminorella richardii]|uniref:Uncharacterized protein n=1 Tax=Leminorella richardii TaxID=158841 RepID=A0A2X4XRX4_9GAMM|nr:Uncharacterised protein [Leminorella richardii]
MYKLTLPRIGPELDAAICRKVFGMPEWKKAVLRKIRLLPRYSMKWDKALQVTNFFYEMDASDPRLKRYNQYMAGFGPTRKGIAGNVIVWSCPSNVCQAAIYALSIFK